MDHDLDRALERAFTAMSKAKTITYKDLPSRNCKYASSHVNALDSITHNLNLINGNAYEELESGRLVSCDHPVQSLTIKTLYQKILPIAATVTTNLCFFPSCGEADLNKRINKAIDSQVMIGDFLKKEKHSIDRFQIDLVNTRGAKRGEFPLALGGNDYTLVIDNTPLIGVSERKPILTMLREFDVPPNGVKACASSLRDIENLNNSLSKQTSMLRDYLD
jgi:hypothetical protein